MRLCNFCLLTRIFRRESVYSCNCRFLSAVISPNVEIILARNDSGLSDTQCGALKRCFAAQNQSQNPNPNQSQNLNPKLKSPLLRLPPRLRSGLRQNHGRPLSQRTRQGATLKWEFRKKPRTPGSNVTLGRQNGKAQPDFNLREFVVLVTTK
jgi:hypothetical protein